MMQGYIIREDRLAEGANMKTVPRRSGGAALGGVLSLVDESYPDTYFTFPVSAASIGK